MRDFLKILMLFTTMLAHGQPPGRLVDIGDRQVHVVERAGTGPVVVLEAGGGAFSSYWHAVQWQIGDKLGLRTISYDRAGLGWSDAAPGPYRIEDRAADLDALLRALAVETPVVLVGASYGGWVAKAFASRYPERLAALVLVDANSAHFFEHFADVVAQLEADGTRSHRGPLNALRLRMQRAWLAKHSGAPCAAFAPLLERGHRDAVKRFLAAFGATTATMRQVVYPDVPTIMISRGRAEKGFPWGNPLAETVWRDGHVRAIENLGNAEHWVAEQAGHAVTFEQPQIVIDAVAAVTSDAYWQRSRRRVR